MRAIDSVLSQADVDAQPLVVINGNRYAPEVRQEVERLRSVRSTYVSEGHVGLAQHVGVSMADTPYFSFLDDDDVLLPGGLSTLCSQMESDSEADFAVGNGFVGSGRAQRLLFPRDAASMAALRDDPASALLRSNWLASCGGLYRRDRIGTEIFDGRLRHFEWTYYAFRLACSFRGGYIDEPVFRVADTPDSASKKIGYTLDYCRFLDRLESLANELRPDLVPDIRDRQLRSYNSAAVALSRLGRVRESLSYHRQVLRRRGGLRYLPAVIRTLTRFDR